MRARIGEIDDMGSSDTMALNFSSFPIEIRNQIYEELLVLSEPIIIEMARTAPVADVVYYRTPITGLGVED
jgi:hypothetical protein